MASGSPSSSLVPRPQNGEAPLESAGSSDRRLYDGAAEGDFSACSSMKSPRSLSMKSPRRDVQHDELVKSLRCRADLLASRNRFEDALVLVEEAMRLEPQNADLHLGKGQCLTRLGRSGEALRCFDAALAIDPKHVAEESKAGLLMADQRWEEAAACLRKVIESQGQAGSGSQLTVELAKCLTEQGVQMKTAGQPRPHFFRDALQVCPNYAQAYFQLGVDYSEANDHARAKDMYIEAVRLNQGYVEAWNNLGCAYRALQEPENALESYRMALKVNQNCKKTRENMAICLLELGCRQSRSKSFKEAAAMFKQALTYNSKNADIYFHMGVMYAESGKLGKAKVHYELATHFDENHVDAWNNQGVIHRREGNGEAAIFCFEKSVHINPKMHLANKNLGACYGAMGRMSEAIKLTKCALEINPSDAEAYNNLALLHRDQGDLEVCLEHLAACLKLEPKNHHACSNRLMTLNYFSDLTREEVYDAHRSFGEDLERRIPLDPPRWRSSASEGLLRIGYISPDFYRHSVSYFIHAPLKHHDPAYVHVTCYSDVASEDDKTQLFKSFAHRWRHIYGQSDEEVARMIREDGIDILVELTGHTGNNRLSVLARRPAPVQVTWIGYPHTTGLSRVDYRISDDLVDPPDCPGLTAEKLVYLPECFLCYTPPDNAPPIGLKPAQEAYGCVTFGCFNNLAKVCPLTLRLWCALLHEMPDSRLFLKSKAFLCSEVQAKFRRAFAGQGIESHRVDLSGLQPHTGSHLSMYNFIDVALDTAPYAGTTTTCEALYMGVPVVTLRGRGIHAQNVGASLLASVQLGDLVASSEVEYVQKASELARNVKRLGALRAGLRTRMERSPLCDGPRHTARLERLYGNLVARGPSEATATDAPEDALPPEPQ